MFKNMQPAVSRFLRIYLIMFSLLSFCFPRFSHSMLFNITSFDSDTDNIAIEGDPRILSNGYVNLNTENQFRVGHLIYTQPLRLWDSTKGVVTDFSTRFSFTIANSTVSFADGFAFYMAPINFLIPPNSAGIYLGLFNSSTLADEFKKSIVFVEFDTFPNTDVGDPPWPHVGINYNSLESGNYTEFDTIHNMGKRGHALITYNATTKCLTVCWSFMNTSLEDFSSNSTLSLRIDLMKALPEWVTIGFSASTGLHWERHVIHSWEFSSTLNSTNSATNRHVVIVSVTCSLSLLIIVALVCWYFRHRRRGKQEDDNNQISIDSELKATTPREFRYQELVAATNGFANNKKLGQGGSGQVYRGVLNDSGHLVAVKRISAEFGGSERVFINEMRIISRLIHRNLVQLIGWCHEKGEFLLVFEYMPYGSLDTHLFGDRKVLPWNLRYKIALGVITAVHYLHEETEQCVLHRDIKSANVLLDADFSVKLGDFGLAKLADTRIMTQTGLVGTLGYLAPEYISIRKATKQTDIYSFGVIILEIACGRRTYQEGDYHITLANWVWQLYTEGNILKAADERLNMNFDVNEMKCLLIVGLWCTRPNDKERPKASQVIKVIQQEIPFPDLSSIHGSANSHSNPFQENYNLTQPQSITISFAKDGR